MKRAGMVTAVLLTLGVVVAFAQAPNFAGTWMLNKEKSDSPAAGRGGRGGGRFGRGPAAMPATLVITQSETELTIEQKRGGQSRTLTYKLDGTDSTNSAGRGELTTKSRWDGSTLVTEGSQELSTPRGDFTIELKEVRTLSPDGQTMIIETTRMTPRGENTVRLVYQKVTT